jgi:adenosine deaminase
MQTVEFLRALPKAELHLHFEGSVPWAMIRAHAREALPERPAWWAEDFRFDDFTHFRREASRTLACLVDPPAYRRAAELIFRDLAGQNVRYVEISLDIMRVLDQPLALDEVVGAVGAAAPPGLVVRVFGAFAYHKHDRTPDAAVADALATPGLSGIDLHGDEAVQSTARFREIFVEARRQGLATKAHAGELAGAASVAAALDLLGVRRIQHGVRAIEDDRLVDRLAAEGVTLDTSPWSNVRLRIVGDLATHPIRRLHERGVRLTISTDDPTLFGRSLTQELAGVVETIGLSPADVARMQANAFEVAALPAATRAAALREIDALVARAAPGRA